MVNSGEHKKAPVSLRLRLIVLAALVTAISLGLVGLALDAAFHKSSEAGLNARLESLVYLVLAATEVADDGSLSVQDDPGDPRLSRPGSGIYARVHGQNDQWISPSLIGINLPSLQAIGQAQLNFWYRLLTTIFIHSVMVWHMNCLMSDCCRSPSQSWQVHWNCNRKNRRSGLDCHAHWVLSVSSWYWHNCCFSPLVSDH